MSSTFSIICKAFDNFTGPNLQPYKKYMLVTTYTAATAPMRRKWKKKSVHAVCP